MLWPEKKELKDIGCDHREREWEEELPSGYEVDLLDLVTHISRGATRARLKSPTDRVDSAWTGSHASPEGKQL